MPSALLQHTTQNDCVSADLSHRCDSPAQFLDLLSHRVEAPWQALWSLYHRCSDKINFVDLLHRVQAPREMRKDLTHRAEASGPEIEQGELMPDPPEGSARPPGTRFPGLSEWELAWQQGRGTLSMELYAGTGGNTDVSGIPYRFEVTHGRSQAATWQMSIVDSTGQFHPLRSDGAYKGVFGITKNHRMRADIKWGGREFKYQGYPTNFGHARNSKDGGWFRDEVWSGVDESRPLFLPSKSLPTVRSTKSKIARKIPTAQEIVAQVGLSIRGLKDGPIRLMHRQSGRLGDMLARLVEMDGQEWHMVGKVVEAYDAMEGSGGGFTYTVKQPVRSENYDSAISDVLTRVVCRRLNETETGGVDKPEVHTTFGKYQKSFPGEWNAVKWSTPVQNLGIFSDFIFRDKNGDVVAVWDVRGGVWPQFLVGRAIRNAVSVEYSWGAKEGVVATEGYGEILFSGVPNPSPSEDEDIPDEFQTEFDVTVFDAELEEIFDEILEELDTNELIATEAQGRSFGRGYLNKLKAALFPLTIAVPLNPAIVDGTPITIIDEVLGITHKRPAITAKHSFSDDSGDRWTQFVIGGPLG